MFPCCSQLLSFGAGGPLSRANPETSRERVGAQIWAMCPRRGAAASVFSALLRCALAPLAYPTHPTLPYPTLPYPILSYPTLPWGPALSVGMPSPPSKSLPIKSP